MSVRKLVRVVSYTTFSICVCEGQTSGQCPVTSGVPQGTVLGPLLFLLYINDLPDNVQQSSVRVFADDALLYGVVPSDADCLHQRDLQLYAGLNPGSVNGKWSLILPSYVRTIRHGENMSSVV